MVFPVLFWSSWSFWSYFCHFRGLVLFWLLWCFQGHFIVFRNYLVIQGIRMYFGNYGVFELIWSYQSFQGYFGHYGVYGVIFVIFWGYFGHFMGSVLFWSLLCFRVILFILEFSGLFLSFQKFYVHVSHYGVSGVILVTLKFSRLVWWFTDILVVLGVLSVFWSLQCFLRLIWSYQIFQGYLGHFRSY